MNESTGKFIIFELGKEKFGVPVEQVISIERMGEITTVPKAKDYIRGILNLRSLVIPIVDLRVHFYQIALEDHDETRIIVVQVNDFNMGFVVDTATEVLDIPEDKIQELNIAKAQTDSVSKVANLDECLIILLDIAQLIKDMDTAGTIQAIKNAIPEQVNAG